ncbi:hypothetical protein DDB_G0275511 [Dictyostelium discoideum AX4]|uniref:Uncharacterized protein n=1 Tax=Dictyostelium discoideum TaxID=44689 RepID=Q86IC4_DICDI|nr:hypothetical protein DDB_G0275511 [Dictyostelium discoideum AX4]EAL69506.1 hypothetical protein DDB_G0275511 [Dictyostelium discoideum AX4]|eukprot:XP_643602.1 hypothetical protein DDB_G0275511 [Dictyostelium discoideum AX4]
MINPNFNNSNNNNNFNNDNYKIKIEFLLNQKPLNINSNSQEKISNVKEKKNKLTNSNPIIIKKTKDQKKIIEPLKNNNNNKIQIEHLQSNVRCKKCNELPSFKHDNKRWYCKFCEKPFTPISFKNLTTENFQK